MFRFWDWFRHFCLDSRFCQVLIGFRFVFDILCFDSLSNQCKRIIMLDSTLIYYGTYYILVVWCSHIYKVQYICCMEAKFKVIGWGSRGKATCWANTAIGLSVINHQSLVIINSIISIYIIMIIYSFIIITIIIIDY